MLEMAIRITNYKNLEIINYALPLLIGEVIGIDTGEILVKNKSNNTPFISWPVVKGKFKVLVRLSKGLNVIVMQQNAQVKELHLQYQPMQFKKFVRLVYIVCKDDEGVFQCPDEEDCSVKSACERISLAIQMLQTFTTDQLKSHCLPKRTFCLEEGPDAQPICHVFQTKLLLSEALKLSEIALWEYFAVELMNSNLRIGNNCKFLGILSFTRYENKSSELPKNFKQMRQFIKGYAALAAGGLALLGSASLHTWPSSLSQVSWRFGDDRQINKRQFLDDSCNRGFHWACYSTTLGATLHELGHVFDLGHSQNGIMSRGFDNIYKFFIVDLFYCSHPYQKKNNPFYQEYIHENHHLIKLSKSSTWLPKHTKEQHQTNFLTTNENDFEKSQDIQKAEVMKTPSSTTKPPWKVLNPPENEVPDDTESHWARSSAIILCYHKWFNDFEDVVEHEMSRNGLTFSSPHGIRIIEFRDDKGTAFHHLEFLSDNLVTEVDISKSNVICHVLGNVTEMKVHVQDSRGNILQHSFDTELLKVYK